MMRLADQYINLAILSLHAGHAIARTTRLIINPHNLTVAGFYCQPLRTKSELILVPQNIRETTADGLVINHEEDLGEKEDLVRLREVLRLNYQLAGKPVVTESKKRLGKVSTFAIDNKSWSIVKLHVQRPLWRAIFESALIIDRNAIVTVSQRAIVVKDATVKAEAEEAAPATVPTAAA